MAEDRELSNFNDFVGILRSPKDMSERMSENLSEDVSEKCQKEMSEDVRESVRRHVRKNIRNNVRRYARKNARIEAARGELEASGRGSLHGHWEIRGVSLTLQSAIEQFADKPGANGRSRGGDEERRKRRRKRGGDEADIKSNNPHLTDTQRG